MKKGDGQCVGAYKNMIPARKIRKKVYPNLRITRTSGGIRNIPRIRLLAP